jgi:type IV pilus assembly protein PilX
MKFHSHSGRSSSRQRGAALVVSLLLLLVMTLLGLGASQSTFLQERMAGNQRDEEIALQAAEAALRGAEKRLSPDRDPLKPCTAPGVDCDYYEPNTLVDERGQAFDLAAQPNLWWVTWGREYEFADELEGVATDPEFVTELAYTESSTATINGPGFKTERDFYNVTARSSGQSETAKVVLQSSYARIVFTK